MAMIVSPVAVNMAHGADQKVHLVRFGAYDPHDKLNSNGTISIEHIFVAWQDLDEKTLDHKIAIARRAHRTLMVSVEPFTHAPDWRAGGDHLFADILNGGYDREIKGICSKAASAGVPIIMRWGHEMEDVDGRYPWARRDATGYRKAFAYFVTKCREILPKARYVWSPKGSRNLAKYYPGNAYVDIIGIPLWGLRKMDIDYWQHERSFSETLREKYSRVKRFGKPLMIAELGVSGDAEYRQKWYREIFKPSSYVAEYPLVHTILFFNDKEPYHWPGGYGSPDWRLDQDALPLLSASVDSAAAK